VRIKLDATHGKLLLEVSDNGKGLTAARSFGAKSLGLLGMRERAIMLDGEVTIVGRRAKARRWLAHSACSNWRRQKPTINMRILITDDHAVVRRGLKQILADDFKKADFGEAANAREAIERIRKENWDVVVLDVSMPAAADWRR